MGPPAVRRPPGERHVVGRIGGTLGYGPEGRGRGRRATAQEAGIRWPVALTRAAWERCVTVPPGVACQDEAGRLWDVALMLACAIRRGGSGPEVRFGVSDRTARCPSGKSVKLESSVPVAASDRMPLGRV